MDERIQKVHPRAMPGQIKCMQVQDLHRATLKWTSDVPWVAISCGVVSAYVAFYDQFFLPTTSVASLNDAKNHFKETLLVTSNWTTIQF